MEVFPIVRQQLAKATLQFFLYYIVHAVGRFLMPDTLEGSSACYGVFENFRNNWQYISFPDIEV